MADQIDILLVEDNEADIVLVREALKDAKVFNTLHVARKGEEAMDFLRSNDSKNPEKIVPGLILLDLYMPKKGGMEVLSEIKHDDTLRTIPVVVMTSSIEEEDIVKAYDNQANCYVTKPVDFEQLIKVVEAIWGFWLRLVQLPKPK